MVSFKLFTALAALAPMAFAHPASEGVVERAVETRQLCKAEPSPEFLAQAAAFSSLEKTYDNSTSLNILADGARAAAATITIQTYFHVVAKSTSLSGGYVPQSQLTAQINAMNKAYAPYGIQFNLAGTDYTINTSWASDGNETAMKRALRKGDYKTLNLYFLSLSGGTLGYCYFPTTTTTGSSTFYLDGCSIQYTTVPGGSATGFNLGLTAVHEVGHWFGLLHTFQGSSCTGSGDSVSDTPAQLSPTSGCPTGRDSCPNQAGLDPIHNYMDYSSDACYSEFTAGQNTRMLNMYNTYRA